MNKVHIFLTVALMIAALGCGGGRSGSASNETVSQYGGVYETGDHENFEMSFGTLLIYPQTDSDMVFYLSKNGGAPGYSSGATAGQITIIDGKATFRARSQCEDAYYKLHFEFKDNYVTVTQEDEGAMNCSFAYAVIVNDRFERTSSEIPQYIRSENEDAEPYYFSNWREWIGDFQAQPVENVISEMYPTLGRHLNFNPEDAAGYTPLLTALNNVDWDVDKLTEQQKALYERIEIVSEVHDYWEFHYGPCDSWGAYNVTASSYLPAHSATINYAPANANNYRYSDAWVEGVAGHGVGEYLTFHFRPQSMHITAVIIGNGYVKSEQAYRDNSRPKKLKMYVDDIPIAILNLEDVRREQIFKFDQPLGVDYDVAVTMGLYNNPSEEAKNMQEQTVKFEIMEVYPGARFDDTAISLISFYGMSGCCFAAGTQILMSDNLLKNIEFVQTGDMIKSYCFDRQQMIDTQVTRLIAATHSGLLRLKFADNEIITTADHPFWIERAAGWAAVNAAKANSLYMQQTEVVNIQIGDRIFIPAQNIFSEIIEIESIIETQITYTIEVSEGDNFIANCMLVKTEIVK